MKDVDLIALAGLLHDIGKFGQRAGITLRVPFNQTNYGYKHSAYTAQILQDYFNDIQNYHQFAVEHHIVDSNSDEKSWIIATADRLASGFEREEFEEYNKQTNFEDFRSQRLYGIFDENKRYKIDELSSDTIFPLDGEAKENEYVELWKKFEKSLKILQESEGSQETDILALDYLLKRFTTFMPSSTSFKKGAYAPVKANIPLYDHLKATAIFAAAISKLDETKRENLINYYRKSAPYKEDKEFLLINGDFFGIQDFIFNDVEAKAAAKILRARSAYVQLLTRVIAFYIIEELGLSKLSIVSDNAGKFEILAPNEDEIKKKLFDIQEKLNDFFAKEFFAQTGIGLSYEECGLYDFIEKGRYQSRLRGDLAKKVENTKLHKFDLHRKNYDLSWEEKLDNQNQCPFCKKRMATKEEEDFKACEHCYNYIKMGQKLAEKAYLIITKDKIDMPLFKGYFVKFLDKNSKPKALRNTVAIYDISKDRDFRGYAKWEISSYVATKDMLDDNEIEFLAKKEQEIGKILTFENLASLSVKDGIDFEQLQRDHGIEALMALKGDVDNMGKFLMESDVTSSFAKFNFFSRMVDYFYSVYVPFMMKKKYPHTYTIFSGGDDFFIIGAWDETMDLAKKIRQDFMDFASGSPLTVSMGLVLTKPNKPVNFIGDMAEKYLEKSKDMPQKDSVTIFDESVKWKAYLDDLGLYEIVKKIDTTISEGLPTSFLYRLLELVEYSKKVKAGDPKATIWKSKLAYIYHRNIEDKAPQDMAHRFLSTLDEMIEKYPQETKVWLSKFIYERRK